MTAPKIIWEIEAVRNRVFYDPATKDLLIFSKKTWKDFPVVGAEFWPAKPSGWRFKWWSWWYGPSVARFFWRNHVGQSSVTPGLKKFLGY